MVNYHVKRFEVDHISVMSRWFSQLSQGQTAGQRNVSLMEKKMKKGIVFNSDISSMIPRLGYTDTLMVCDAGLPIPKSATRIDMALTQGVSSFMQVLDVVTNKMQVGAVIIVEEIKQHNPQLHKTLFIHLEQLQQHQGNTTEIRYTMYEQFKQQTAESQAVTRSGGYSPYVNIILCAGMTL